ncbi:MAG: serine/threonine protein kinase, partial [Candidatus Obscuribacterales bacterium]|nr:serine/threonine protein kinase [Candidatus Obscuribacterales bacterium]
MASENGSEANHWKVQTPQNALNEIKTSEIELPEQYELLGKLNQGAMGAVYKAKNRYTEAKFAIKVLKPECANDAETRQRFILEAKASSTLKHPQICEVFDFGCMANGMLFLVMQWIDGISLQSMIDKDGPLPAKEALPLFIQIASALGHAHKHKIIHRDLKPANVMLSGSHDGKINVHIVDFGIAKVLSDEEDAANRSALTRTGIVLGTPLYMSPEQSRGKSLNQRSDIYALGCLIYFVLTGHPPFEGDGLMDTMYKHIHEPPPDFDASIPVPEDLKLIML